MEDKKKLTDEEMKNVSGGTYKRLPYDDIKKGGIHETQKPETGLQKDKFVGNLPD